jgi:alpha-beta hydrolase superfamily lysophospholipase
MKTALYFLAGLVAVWILGDFLYSRVIAWRMARWEVTVERHPNGVRVGCEDFTVGKGDTALLLVHGINDSPAIYHKMAPRLAEKGFACRAMRLPGFAMPIEDYAASTHEQWVEAIGREAESLRRTHSRVCIVAHSLGGAAAINYLLEHPQAAETCVLIAPCAAVSGVRSPLLTPRAWHTIGDRLLIFTRVTETPFPNDAHDPAERTYASRTKYCPRSVFHELFELTDKNEGRAQDFRTPLLMVLSKDDQVIDWEAAYEFYQRAASPEKKVFFMEDAGHAIPVDYGWEQVADEIAAFAAPPPPP